MNRNNFLRIIATKKIYNRQQQILEQIPKTKRNFNLKINRIKKSELKLRVQKKIVKLPLRVDLRNKCQPIVDQGNLGSCTACALVAIVGYDKKKLFGSRLFLYYNERMLDNTISEDTGAYLSDGIKSLQLHGVCQETSWPYDINKFAEKPYDSCYEEALNNQALSVENINNNLNAMKNSLANNEPFVVGIAVYSSFTTRQVARNGYVPMPNRNDIFLGGHAVVCVGYDDIRKVWIMRNSWGTSWGDKGYFYLPYAYLTNSSLSTDLWIIKKMEM